MIFDAQYDGSNPNKRTWSTTSGHFPTSSTSIGSARTTGARPGARRVRRRTVEARRAKIAKQRPIGLGLVDLPETPKVSPTEAVMKDTSLPRHRRYCAKCGTHLGSRDVSYVAGSCPECGCIYNFRPNLHPHDVVAGQYRILGCLAYGGMGWTYLAEDRKVSGRHVVLKGLLNEHDSDAVHSAIAELKFLAEVSHPNIVEIHNFVEHDGRGYIVMEYIAGKSLKEILRQRSEDNGGKYNPLSVAHALAYILEILPAISHLHDLGLVYCDFKPDNVLHIGNEVRLIDLGGVRRRDDEHSIILGTAGYQAPEIAHEGVSVGSDIYTIGRTLLVLTCEFKGYLDTYKYDTPPQAFSEVFEKYDAFYRLVCRACAPEPDDRFVSVHDLQQQMVGVLREVVAIDAMQPTAFTTTLSALFSPPDVNATAPDWTSLPTPFLRHPEPVGIQLHELNTRPGERLAELRKISKPTSSDLIEMSLLAVHVRDSAAVSELTEKALALDPWDWRARWVQGLDALRTKESWDSVEAFHDVYSQVPGELAPKMALAMACEVGGRFDLAEQLYSTCMITDQQYVSSCAFALARIHLSVNDIDNAIASYRLVPKTSGSYPTSCAEVADVLARRARSIVDLNEALDALEISPHSGRDKSRLRASVYRSALRFVQESTTVRQSVMPFDRVGDVPMKEKPLQFALESALRDQARYEEDTGTRQRLIDEANQVRPWTWR